MLARRGGGGSCRSSSGSEGYAVQEKTLVGGVQLLENTVPLLNANRRHKKGYRPCSLAGALIAEVCFADYDPFGKRR